MKAKLIGYRQLDFTTEKGDSVKGTSVYMSYGETGVVGEIATKFFLRPEMTAFLELTVGKSYSVEFNPNGRLMSINEMPATAATEKK
jgi:hypothetical protein